MHFIGAVRAFARVSVVVATNRLKEPWTHSFLWGTSASRVEQPHLVPVDVGEDVLRDIGDALAGDEREGEGRVHEQPAEFGLSDIVVVEVYRRTVSKTQNL